MRTSPRSDIASSGPIAGPTLPARSSSYELPGEAIGMHSVIEYVGRTTAPDQARSSSATAAGSAAAPLR